MRKFLLSKIRRLHISRNSFSPLGLSSDTRTAFEPSFGVQSQLDKKLSVFVSPKKIHKDISRYSLYTLFSAANVASHSLACSSFLDFLLYLQAMLWLTVNGINFFLASESWSTDTFTREPGVRHIENYDNAGQKKNYTDSKNKHVYHGIPIISIFGMRQTSISNSRRTFPLSSIDLHRRV